MRSVDREEMRADGRAEGGRRARRADEAIVALLTERTIAAAAKCAGIGESTLLRRLWDPAFVTKYRAARRGAVEGAVAGLQQAATLAVDALKRNLRCGNPAVEVGAAKAVLDQAMRGIEVLDLEERIVQLEGLSRNPQRSEEVA